MSGMSDSQQYLKKLCQIKYELSIHFSVLKTIVLGFSKKVICAFLASVTMVKLQEINTFRVGKQHYFQHF